LGIFSQQLIELNLNDITIGAEFFWSSSFDAHAPHWPHLSSITIDYNPITPSGQWLRERDPSEPAEEIDYGEDLLYKWKQMRCPIPKTCVSILSAINLLRSIFHSHSPTPEPFLLENHIHIVALLPDL
jgi:hypothetical protein